MYDIRTESKEGQKRLTKVRKIARRYLKVVQNSVFEGTLTEGVAKKLELEVKEVVNRDSDSAIMYMFPESTQLRRIFITNTEDHLKKVW